MRNMFSVDGNFDDKGFLALGFAGHQPDLANYYTNNVDRVTLLLQERVTGEQ